MGPIIIIFMFFCTAALILWMSLKNHGSTRKEAGKKLENIYLLLAVGIIFHLPSVLLFLAYFLPYSLRDTVTSIAEKEPFITLISLNLLLGMFLPYIKLILSAAAVFILVTAAKKMTVGEIWKLIVLTAVYTSMVLLSPMAGWMCV